MRLKRDEIKHKILKISKAEFMVKGFRDASLREIAKKSGYTTGTIYTYFRNKNEILEILVLPVINKIEHALGSKEISFEEAKYSQSDLKLWFSRYIRLLIELIEKYPVEMKLLFIKSNGSKYENYKNELIEIGKGRGKNDFNNLKRTKQFEGQELSGIFIHNLVNFVFNSVLEILKRDTPKKDIKKFEIEISTFLFNGWKGLVKV